MSNSTEIQHHFRCWDDVADELKEIGEVEIAELLLEASDRIVSAAEKREEGGETKYYLTTEEARKAFREEGDELEIERLTGPTLEGPDLVEWPVEGAYRWSQTHIVKEWDEDGNVVSIMCGSAEDKALSRAETSLGRGTGLCTRCEISYRKSRDRGSF